MTYADILLTADFDRTLTAPDSTVPARNCQAILDFMARGGTFTVNTGRSLPMYRPYISQVPVNAPLLLYNGSAAIEPDTGKLLFSHVLDFDPQVLLRDVLARYPEQVIELQGFQAHYTIRHQPMWEAYCRENGCTYGRIQEAAQEPFLKFTLYERFWAPTVAHLFTGSPEALAHMDRVEQELKQLLGDRAAVYRAAPRIIDIHAAGVSKAAAARELQRRLGKKLLICVGDGENDLPMLEGADYAFCPADSVLTDRFPNVCACAQGAVADVIYEKIPQILAQYP